MSNYSRQQDFSAKDSLTTGDPEKVILGADVDDELDAARTAINSKMDLVTGHTTDNLGSVNASGELADSGFAASDFCQGMPITDRTANFDYPTTGRFKMQRWTEATAAARTATMLAASAYGTNFYGYLTNGSAFTCTIAPNGTDTINGVNASVSLLPGQTAIIVRDDAAAWVITTLGSRVVYQIETDEGGSETSTATSATQLRTITFTKESETSSIKVEAHASMGTSGTLNAVTNCYLSLQVDSGGYTDYAQSTGRGAFGAGSAWTPLYSTLSFTKVITGVSAGSVTIDLGQYSSSAATVTISDSMLTITEYEP